MTGQLRVGYDTRKLPVAGKTNLPTVNTFLPLPRTQALLTHPSSLSGLAGRNDLSKRNDTMMMLSLVCPV